MNHLRRAVPITLGLFVSTAFAVAACDDVDDTPAAPFDGGSTTDGGKDSSVPSTDSGGGFDSGLLSDSGGFDTGTDTGIDAAPTLTSDVGNTGTLLVYNDVIIGELYEDNTILHWSNAPGCVAFIRSQTKTASVGGTLTVGGAVVGKDGGADQALQVDADPMSGNQYFGPGPVFPLEDTYTVSVELAAGTAFAAMPVQTMRPPPANPITVTKPVIPDGGAAIPVPSNAAFEIKWTAPTGGFTAEQNISFRLSVLAAPGPTGKLGDLFCAFPLSAGTATIPTNVLAEMKTRAGGAADATLHVFAGSAKEVKTATGSYFVEVARTDSTSLQFDPPARLE